MHFISEDNSGKERNEQAVNRLHLHGIRCFFFAFFFFCALKFSPENNRVCGLQI